jgi:dephospho-CoA kinase
MAAKANAGDLFAQTKLKQLGIHASEYSWAGTDFDAIIDNNGSIEQLYSQLKSLAQ